MGCKQYREKCLQLMNETDVVYVSTIDEEGFPQTRVMFNLRNREQYPSLAPLFKGHDFDFLIYLATTLSSAKLAQIAANPAACVCFCKAKEFRSLMLAGPIEVVTEKEIKRALWQNGWKIYYPAGPEDPEYVVLRMRPVKGKGWCRDHPHQFTLGGTS